MTRYLISGSFILIFLLVCSIASQAQTTAWDGNAASQIVNAGSGTGEENSPIEIASPAELAYLAQQTNAGGKELTLGNGTSIKNKTNFKGVYFKLTDDIDLGEQAWIPIGKDNSNSFQGVLDGSEMTISNLGSISTTDNNYAGLFGIIENGSVLNLHIEIVAAGLHVEKVDNVGSLAGYSKSSKITNCHVKGSSIIGDNPSSTQLAVGGLIGQIISSEITGCNSTVDVKATFKGASALFAGGICGANMKASITNCQFSGSVMAVDEQENGTPNSYAGGITGASDLVAIGGSYGTSTISECTADVNISAGAYAGGIVGYFVEGDVEKCTVEGAISIKETSGQAGGIMGCNKWGGTVTDCYNTASVTSLYIAAGIVGYEYTTYSFIISKCWSSGDVTAPIAGGIAGKIGFNTIKECYATGNIIGRDPTGGCAGGIAAYTISETIKDCSSTANVTAERDDDAESYAGGIVGLGIQLNSYQKTSIQNCYAIGKISADFAAGGIAGKNLNGSITNCLSLNKEGIGETIENKSILKDSPVAFHGRITGEATTLASNFASPLIPGDWSNDASGKDGDVLTSDNFTKDTGKAFDQWDDADVWSFDPSGKNLPILKAFGENTGDGQPDIPVQPEIPKSDFLAFTLTFTTPLNGTITVSSPTDVSITTGTPVAGGTVLTITAIPETGYELVSLKVNGTDFTSGETHIVNADVKIEATFKIQTYTINYDLPSNGTIRITYLKEGTETEVPSATSLDYGTELTIKATPKTGYKLENLQVNNTDFTSGNTYTVNADVTVEATFSKIPDPLPDPDPVYPTYTYYTITLPKVEGVTTTPSAGSYSCREGSKFSFCLALDSAYSQSQPIVTLTDGSILEPDTWGYYTIRNLYRGLEVFITGIKKNPLPVANATIEFGMQIRVAEGNLYIRLPYPTRIRIITFGGQVIQTLQLPAGDNCIPSLPKGIYLIQPKGGKTVKVVI